MHTERVVVWFFSYDPLSGKMVVWAIIWDNGEVLFCGACVLVVLACMLVESYVFSSGSVWVILTCGTFLVP